MSRKLVHLMVAVLLVLAQLSTVFAAEAPSLKTKVETHIMPEYDTSDVLVIHALEFTNTTAEPYQGAMRFSVPKGTTNNIVKENTSGDSHLQVQVEDKGEYAQLVWQPTQPIQPNATYSIHLEYYYNPLPGTGSKAFAYKYVPAYAVDSLRFFIYQPLQATELKVEPAAQLLGQDDKGFSVYGLEYSGLLPEAPVELKVSYTKNDPQPSVQAPAYGGAQNDAGQGNQFASLAVIIPMVIMGALLVLIAVKAMNKRPAREVDYDEDEDEEELDAAEEVTKPVVKTPTKPASKPKGSPELAKAKQELEKDLKRGLITEDYYYELLAELEEKYK